MINGLRRRAERNRAIKESWSREPLPTGGGREMTPFDVWVIAYAAAILLTLVVVLMRHGYIQ